jgi:hypothetical protein
MRNIWLPLKVALHAEAPLHSDRGLISFNKYKYLQELRGFASLLKSAFLFVELYRYAQ